ncbi:MAG TPA: ABC transporter substrate-binding protein [Xanthobacteraceae bacterium]|nr:ABC transporter substrate-binding protein [Xanthobacteraceae bacterium]
MTARAFALRLLAAMAAMASCALSPLGAQEAPPKTIRLAGPGNAQGTPFGTGTLGVLRVKAYLEQEFKPQGGTIEWQYPRGTGPAINEAFANGQLDFASYGGLPNIVGHGAGLRTKVLATYGTSPIYLVARNGSGIESIADLKGRRISVQRGTILELALGSLLQRQGLSEKDVQIFDLITADQISALQSGDIDAVVGTSSVLTVVERGFSKVVFSSKGKLDPASNFGAFLVAEDFVRKYPQTTQRVLNDYVRAAYFASQEENRSELYDIWARSGTTRAAIAADYDGEVLNDRSNPLLDAFFVSNVKRGVKFALDNKLIRQGFDINAWIDRAPLYTALDALGFRGVWKPHDANGAPQG